MKNSHPPKTALFLPFHRFSDRSVRRSRPRIRHFFENDEYARMSGRSLPRSLILQPICSRGDRPVDPAESLRSAMGRVQAMSASSVTSWIRTLGDIGGLQCCRRMLLYSQEGNQFNTMSKRILLELQLVDGSIDPHHVVPDVV